MSCRIAQHRGCEHVLDPPLGLILDEAVNYPLPSLPR